MYFLETGSRCTLGVEDVNTGIIQGELKRTRKLPFVVEGLGHGDFCKDVFLQLEKF